MKIAMAQVPSFTADTGRNIKEHLRAIQYAADHSVSCLVFPELSLTGYELPFAKTLAFSEKNLSVSLGDLSNAAVRHQMHIVAGAPLMTLSGLKLASLIFSPNGRIDHYAKIFLHGDEKNYFTKGTEYKFIDIQQERVALSICADSTHDEHFSCAANLGATVYAASVLLTPNGYEKDATVLEKNARQHQFLVAIANHCQTTGGWEGAGKSAAWGPNGLISQVTGKERSLIIYEKVGGIWQSVIQIIPKAFGG